ncbi:MAG: hypothetical protein DRJ42_03070 [Deltaproteobacteria bacterium]|nr:MAG: hypothetical protein DRJ42_03070 [Deltaproteobacteria bacterium]
MEEIIMNRIIGSMLWITAAFSMASGCQATGVGDPCVPGAIPEDGYVGTEAYLEVSSVECETRVCMVYQLDGIPFGEAGCETVSDVAANPACASAEETEARAYCTCRCDAPPESTGDLCDCPAGDGPDDPNGFSCVEVINAPGAGPGLRGSYCVRNSNG